MSDIVTFAVRVASTFTQEYTVFSLQKNNFMGRIFWKHTIGSLLGENRTTYAFLKQNTPLLPVIKELAAGYHILPVFDENRRLVNLIGQMDICDFVSENSVYFPSISQKSIKELGLGRKERIIQAPTTATAFECLLILSENNVSGLAVVGTDGRLVANFSKTDVQEVTRDTFHQLGLPVLEYLYRTKPLKSFQSGPVICFKNTTLEAALLRIVKRKVHRLFLVDYDLKLEGVISLADIMKRLTDTKLC